MCSGTVFRSAYGAVIYLPMALVPVIFIALSLLIQAIEPFSIVALVLMEAFLALYLQMMEYEFGEETVIVHNPLAWQMPPIRYDDIRRIVDADGE